MTCGQRPGPVPGLLKDPEALSCALFDALPRIGHAITVSGRLESFFSHEYG
ncbi:hypothetical protein [Streptomyces sp. NPDC001978]|uniref:hypothetical protein n=1 Tax=Streptomyces sp. NPDC001978 TaxID=3364627 RepID=UPI00368A70BB